MTPRVIAALLAVFLGGLGFHKFYLGQWVQGLLYLIFCWTGIPTILGWIEAVLYLLKTDYQFNMEYYRG